MANLVIYVTQVIMFTPEQISASIQVSWVDVDGFERSASTDVITSAISSAAEINDVIRSAGRAIAESNAHGVTVGSGDTVRIFGGALPNIS
jgi:hypothetical protein